MRQQFDLVVTGAWHSETFARTKRLKKLASYLSETEKPDPIQGLQSMFDRMKAQGKFVKMTKH